MYSFVDCAGKVQVNTNVDDVAAEMIVVHGSARPRGHTATTCNLTVGQSDCRQSIRFGDLGVRIETTSSRELLINADEISIGMDYVLVNEVDGLRFNLPQV